MRWKALAPIGGGVLFVISAIAGYAFLPVMFDGRPAGAVSTFRKLLLTATAVDFWLLVTGLLRLLAADERIELRGDRLALIRTRRGIEEIREVTAAGLRRLEIRPLKGLRRFFALASPSKPLARLAAHLDGGEEVELAAGHPPEELLAAAAAIADRLAASGRSVDIDPPLVAPDPGPPPGDAILVEEQGDLRTITFLPLSSFGKSGRGYLVAAMIVAVINGIACATWIRSGGVFGANLLELVMIGLPFSCASILVFMSIRIRRIRGRTVMAKLFPDSVTIRKESGEEKCIPLPDLGLEEAFLDSESLLRTLGPTVILLHRDAEEIAWTAAAVRAWVTKKDCARRSEIS